MIEEEREKEYTPSYTFEIPIEEQEISDEAIAMIALLQVYNRYVTVIKKI